MTTFVKRRSAEGGFPPPSRAPLDFHRRLPGYERSPLMAAAALARRLGVRRVWVKDESTRLGLPSFKILGASWGAYRALASRFGDFGPWEGIEDLAGHLSPLRPLALSAATDGNHGRAVARMARLLGLGARIFVPQGTATARIEAIRGEGADCVVVDGSYDDAVERSAQEESKRCLVISDTSWPGYTDVPGWVIDGYSTIFWEVSYQLAQMGESEPDVVVIQVGVGALGAAAARHFRRDGGSRPALVAVEPSGAACVLASVEAGERVTIPGPHRSIMAGLNCGTPSAVAWPDVSGAYDLYVTIDDDRAMQAMHALANEGIAAGETGAAGVGALLEIFEGSSADDLRAHLGVSTGSNVLVVCTEGPTDPRAYEAIVGSAARAGLGRASCNHP
jgi:diaminopropionate ammonia-lyase